MDIAPLTLRSPASDLDAWVELNALAWAEAVPELELSGRHEALAELDPAPDQHRDALIGRVDGVPVGAVKWAEPLLEDRELAWLEVIVAGEHRRKGYGTALLRAAADVLIERGRLRATAEVLEGSPAGGYADAIGTHYVQHSVCNLLTLPSDVDLEQWTTPANGYRLVRWVDRCPDEYLDGLARAMTAMDDAPRGDTDREDWAWSGERIRRREDWEGRQGSRRYATFAIHEATNEVAGVTELRITADRRTTGQQENTAVVRAHRGHGLGITIKAANLAWLREVEPQLRHVVTWNAETNRYMRSVNEQLGFQVVGRWREVELSLPEFVRRHRPVSLVR